MTENESVHNQGELLPCPFCGGDAVLLDSVEAWVECILCQARVDMRAGAAGAISAWNRRSPINPERKSTPTNSAMSKPCATCIHDGEPGSHCNRCSVSYRNLFVPRPASMKDKNEKPCIYCGETEWGYLDSKNFKVCWNCCHQWEEKTKHMNLFDLMQVPVKFEKQNEFRQNLPEKADIKDVVEIVRERFLLFIVDPHDVDRELISVAGFKTFLSEEGLKNYKKFEQLKTDIETRLKNWDEDGANSEGKSLQPPTALCRNRAPLVVGKKKSA